MYRKTPARISYMKKYFGKQPAYYREYQRIYMNKKRHTDPKYNISNRFRALIRISLKKVNVDSKMSVKLLNYTIDELKVHLERLFVDGMTWDHFFYLLILLINCYIYIIYKQFQIKFDIIRK